MPTGAVSWEMLFWIAGLLGSGILGAGGAVLWGVRLFAARDRAIADVREELSLKVLAGETNASAAVEQVASELVTFRQHVGETFATKQGVSVQLERVEQEVRRVGDKIEGKVESAFERLTIRIDRVLEERAK